MSGQSSDLTHLKSGVPQGSVLGPVIFTIYTSPVADIIRCHGLEYHLYADDTHVYIVFSPMIPGSLQVTIHRRVQCIWELQGWMVNNKLKIDEEKTQALPLCSSSQQTLLHVLNIEIGNATVTFFESAHYPGCHVQSNLQHGSPLAFHSLLSVLPAAHYQLDQAYCSTELQNNWLMYSLLYDWIPAVASCLDSMMSWSKNCNWSRMQLHAYWPEWESTTTSRQSFSRWIGFPSRNELFSRSFSRHATSYMTLL